MPFQQSLAVQLSLLASIFLFQFPSSLSLSLITPNSSLISNTITEWTAMGDSYASGIGAGSLPPRGTDPDLCFRCSNAYPEILQSGPGSLQPNPDKLNFVACSGAKFKEIFDHQLRDADMPGRPTWGQRPEFVTLTMGGNDVGILPLVLTCIYSIPILARGCEAVIQRGFDILESEDFKLGILAVIFAVQEKGREKYGPDFHIFVTGYAQLFNSDTVQCDDVTFKLPGVMLPAQYLTRARRKRMNDLAVSLNRAIETIVLEKLNPKEVTFVNYDALFEGHRFCDRDEPNPNDDETWFFARGTTSDPTNQVTSRSEGRSTKDNGSAAGGSFLHRRSPGLSDAQDLDLLSSRNPSNDTVAVTGGATQDLNAAFSDYWRVFHPKSRGHQAIRNQVLFEVNRVQSSKGKGASASSHDTA